MQTLTAAQLDGLTRRDFLKLTGAALLAIFIPRSTLAYAQTESNLPLGRILGASVNVYDQPSLKAKLIHTVWRDLVLPITQVTVGEEDNTHNRVWYHLEGEGYVHSGEVQPVEVRSNPAVAVIPPEGQLAQVSVPFTDAIWNIKYPERKAYRLYYSTVYWILSRHVDAAGTVWYRIWDDKWGLYYHVLAEHLSPLFAQDLAPIAPSVAPDAKRIEVRLKEQVAIAYEHDRPVYMTRVATGAKFRDGKFYTPKGRFQTSRKRPSRHMAAGDPAAPNSYDLPGIPWVCYLTENGISFHGTYWHNDFGRPRSHGCINCTSLAARWFYRWTMPNVPYEEMTWSEKYGTRVDVI